MTLTVKNEVIFISVILNLKKKEDIFVFTSVKKKYILEVINEAVKITAKNCQKFLTLVCKNVTIDMSKFQIVKTNVKMEISLIVFICSLVDRKISITHTKIRTC